MLRSWCFSAALFALFGLVDTVIIGCSDDSAPPATDAGASSSDTATPDRFADRFSFFVTSLRVMRELSASPNGFGGDLRFGQADGLSGADEICRQVAEGSMPNNGKTWRAFLSVTKGPDGSPVHAIDRIGDGPWYDRLGRLVAMNKDDMAQQRPRGADPAIINDLPNETGTPNHNPDGTGNVDNHDILTGTNTSGKLFSDDWGYTCHDWTSSVGSDGRPRCGHSWPRTAGGGGLGGRDGGGIPPRFDGGFPARDGGRPPGLDGGTFPSFDGSVPPGGGGSDIGDINNWMSSLNEAGCAAGVNIIEMGGPNPAVPTVGSGGGYGGIYCFALTP
jgi:hypothetical protein